MPLIRLVQILLPELPLSNHKLTLRRKEKLLMLILLLRIIPLYKLACRAPKLSDNDQSGDLARSQKFRDALLNIQAEKLHLTWLLQKHF
jgi:hypothetical protein